MKSDKRIRIGAVSYLNTKPLVYQLEEFAPRAELVFDLPSRLADDLSAGRLDIALIPSIETFQNPAYRIVSDACIACRGPVLSVKLLSRVPVEDIRTLALDVGSRTSVALVRILLRQRFGQAPSLVPLPIGIEPAHVATDAVLLIGDRAIHPPAEGFPAQWDLGDQWCRWAKLPFVFAMWTARSDVDTSGIEAALRQARDAGCENLTQIAAEHAGPLDMDEGECFVYLHENLHFHLGPREQRGLELFRQLAVELGIVPAIDSAEASNGHLHDCWTS